MPIGSDSCRSTTSKTGAIGSYRQPSAAIGSHRRLSAPKCHFPSHYVSSFALVQSRFFPPNLAAVSLASRLLPPYLAYSRYFPLFPAIIAFRKQWRTGDWRDFSLWTLAFSMSACQLLSPRTWPHQASLILAKPRQSAPEIFAFGFLLPASGFTEGYGSLWKGTVGYGRFLSNFACGASSFN